MGVLSAAPAPNGIGYATTLADTKAFVGSVPMAKLTATVRRLVDEFGSVPKLLALVTTDADTAVTLSPDCVPARLRRAESRWTLKRYTDALTDLDHVIEKYPQHAPALRLRAEVWLAKAEPKAAQSDLQRILDVDPADADARLLSARAYAAAGEEPKAATEFANLIRLSPGSLQPVLRAIGQHADALEKKGLGDAGEWLALALTAIAKVSPKSELAHSVVVAPTDPAARTKYLRALCGDQK